MTLKLLLRQPPITIELREANYNRITSATGGTITSASRLTNYYRITSALAEQLQLNYAQRQLREANYN